MTVKFQPTAVGGAKEQNISSILSCCFKAPFLEPDSMCLYQSGARS